MIRPPYLARVAVGAVAYALEETRKLPETAVSLPMNAISQVLQTTMHAQQFITSLAIRGDEVLEPLVGKPETQPEWATFDEDSEDANEDADFDEELHRLTNDSDETGPEPEEPPAPVGAVSRIDYPQLSLAQLRARLRYLSESDLTELLAYEQDNEARAPFVTMLTNRIATTKAQ